MVCLRKPGALLKARTQLALGGVGACLILSRQMGAVTLAVLLVVLAVTCRREAWQLVREHRPPFVASVGLLAVSGIAVVLWERRYDHPTDTGSPFNRAAIDSFVDSSQNIVHSAIGQFGWLDTPLPIWGFWSWLAVAVTLCGMALLIGDRRERIVLAAVLVATVLVTFGSYSSVFFPVGAGSQGRHLLPLFVFCPTFAGTVVVDRLSAAGLRDALRRAFVAVGVIVAAVQVVGLYYNAQRYAVGVNGPMVFLGDAQWSPRFGWIPWLTIGLAGGVALAAVAIASRPQLGDPIAAGEN